MPWISDSDANEYTSNVPVIEPDGANVVHFADMRLRNGEI